MELAAGAVFLQCEVMEPEQIQIRAVFFDSGRVSMRVLDQPTASSAQTLQQALISSKAIAGCNGGYYKLNGLGVYGLQISDGLVQGEVGNVSDLEAALLVRSGILRIERAKGLVNDGTLTQMVQCSPMLVEKGVQVFSATGSDEPRVSRTFAVSDDRGHWVIGTAERATLSGLARLLVRENLFPNFRAVTAMNLDGGPSSAFWCVTPQGEVREFRKNVKVRNYIGLFPREVEPVRR
ncbi:MAG: phosphodiester glycosidase family protein [Verrucomicrobiaceae bacterium]|nr:phosphodiester glycosidase family protein [Verrucomicrobiaceae bacterium]